MRPDSQLPRRQAKRHDRTIPPARHLDDGNSFNGDTVLPFTEQDRFWLRAKVSERSKGMSPQAVVKFVLAMGTGTSVSTAVHVIVADALL